MACGGYWTIGRVTYGTQAPCDVYLQSFCSYGAANLSLRFLQPRRGCRFVDKYIIIKSRAIATGPLAA
jgi:hypothetical protein